jgi:phosphoglycerate dehydrogenase-like enzyme
LGDVRGKELRDLAIGVIGTGRIGTAVIDRLKGFGCRVLAHDNRPKAAAAYVPLAEIVPSAVPESGVENGDRATRIGRAMFMAYSYR